MIEAVLRWMVVLALCPGCDYLLGLKHVPPADTAPSEPLVYHDAALPLNCSKMSMLSDDFSNGRLALWWPFTTTNVTESGGVARMPLTPGANAAMSSVRYYDLRESSFSVEVTVGSGFASSDYVLLALASARPNYGLQIVLGNLQLQYFRVESGVPLSLGSTPYNAAQHKYWRISNAAGVTYFATSADGVNYTTQVMYPNLDYVGFMAVQISSASSAETYDVTLDNVNSGAAPSPACKSSTVSDDFNSDSFGDRWARSYAVNGTVTAHDGVAELHMNNDGNASQVFLTPTIPIDLTSDAFVVEVPQLDAATNSGQVMEIGVITFTGNIAEFAVTKGTTSTDLVAGISAGGPVVVVGQKTYDSTRRWLRIRESGNVVYWETAPDGKTFELVGSNMLAGLDQAELVVRLAGATSALASSLIVDNVNLPP